MTGKEIRTFGDVFYRHPGSPAVLPRYFTEVILSDMP
jgi:hypothetical protein